jgi:hypothetical protein
MLWGNRKRSEMSEPESNELEGVIRSVSRINWQKTAMIISRSMRECEAKGIETTYEEIAAAIILLCKNGHLESVGDLSNWRHSEVRLPAGF